MYGIPPFGGYGYVRVSSLLAVRWVIMVIPNFQMGPSISGWFFLVYLEPQVSTSPQVSHHQKILFFTWKATMKPWKAIWRPCRGQWLRMLCDRNFWSFVWAFLLLTCRSNGWVGWWWWRQIRESVGQRSEAVATTRRTYWILKIKIG